MANERINVTKTFLPPLEEYEEYLKKIWNSGHITNQGPLVLEFESKIEDYLKIRNFHFVTNGTVALQIALRALDITEGEIITTPFSYVATASSILWERCKPVFVDIEPETFCIDASKLEAAITSKTVAIMPVHVFGNPCDVEEIDHIASQNNLKVIYDAAHAFGVQYKGKSVLEYGDISTLSFHATKLMHTIEGGGVIVKDDDVSEKLELTKRFGHNGDEHFILGINAKADETKAAMGLCNLKYQSQIIRERKEIFEKYEELLGGRFRMLKLREESTYNYAYCPLVFDSEKQLLVIMERLAASNIFPRRYFYPSLNKLPYIDDSQSCPVSEDIANRVICLPLYPGLEEEKVKLICEVILNEK